MKRESDKEIALEEIKLTVDGQEVKAKQGMMVLEAALAADIYIPTLCYYPDLEPYGGCRLGVVEIECILRHQPSTRCAVRLLSCLSPTIPVIASPVLRTSGVSYKRSLPTLVSPVFLIPRPPGLTRLIPVIPFSTLTETGVFSAPGVPAPAMR